MMLDKYGKSAILYRMSQKKSRVLIWVGTSKDDISALPREVKASFGHRLREVQDGKEPLDMKALPQFGTRSLRA
jgi:phage-related protein